MNNRDKTRIFIENELRKSDEIVGTGIEGYDFDQGLNWGKVIEKFRSQGFQASNLSKGIDITRKIIRDKAFTYLGFTSNVVSSGNREVIKYLFKHNMINIGVTTCGAIEEDIIKCFGKFYLGDFNADGKQLRKRGINRIGNIFVPNNRYVKFEEFLQPILKELYSEQKKSGTVTSASDLVWKLGQEINDQSSICYWAWKNKIRLFCPVITDGAIGDNIYFFMFKHEDFIVDVAKDVKYLLDTTYGKKKTGVIILGAGTVKHHILNANMLRNGADYSVFINSSPEFDGSDSGAMPEEAVSWGKLKPDSESVKIFGDASILFPILVGETYAKARSE